MSVVAAGLLLGAVASVVGGALVGLRMVLAHRARTLEHAPVAEIQKKVDELEARLLASAMRR